MGFVYLIFKTLFSVKHYTSPYLIAAASLICLFPLRTLLRRIQEGLQVRGTGLVCEPGHMLSICVCGLAEGKPQARCYVKALSGRGGQGEETCRFQLFGLPSFHPEVVQLALSHLETKQWTSGKNAPNRDSSSEGSGRCSVVLLFINLIFTQENKKQRLRKNITASSL